MRMTRALTVVALAALAGAAGADEQQATANRHVAPVLPNIVLTTNTDGSSTLQVGVDLLIGLSSRWDLSLTPTFIATTNNGLGDLFSFGGDSNGVGTPWGIGLSFAFIDLGQEAPMDPAGFARAKQTIYAACGVDPNGPPPAVLCDEGRKQWFKMTGIDLPNHGGPSDIVKIEAVEACKTFCKTSPDDKSCKQKFSLVATQPPYSISPEDLCEHGLKIWMDKYDRPARDRRGRFPSYVWAGGLSLGASQQQFLIPDPRFTEQLSNRIGVIPLVQKKENELEVRAAASLTYVSTSSPFTIELPLTYKYFATPSTSTLTYCAPAGSVEPPDQMMAPPGAVAPPPVVLSPAQKCSTSVLGAPTHTHEAGLSLYLGYVAKPDAFWRFSIGPALDYQHQAASDVLSASLSAPVYLNFASAPSTYVGDFKGVVVVTPSIGVSVGTFGTNMLLGVSVGVFARRSMFPRALEWL